MKYPGAILTVLLVGACDGRPKEVVAWPGMEASEFNRLNAEAEARLRLDDSGWIGINSPVMFELRHQGDAIRFEGTRSSGGIMVTSSRYDHVARRFTGPARVTTIAFNIGGGMENLSEMSAQLSSQCAELARMAGTPVEPIPTSAQLADSFREASGILREAVICSGEGNDFAFSISASHYENHYRHGGDFGYAFIDGALVAARPER